MLAELRIANFALIERLHLQFQLGFTVLTGETGAGKSLLIDAIGLLVGGRASTDHIRSGEEEAEVEASFHLQESHPLLRRLRERGTMDSNESNLILKRVLSRSGRHRIYLNGSLCPLRVLEELGGTLVDIHGQHEQQSLLSPANQLDAVDAFGGLEDLRMQYRQAYGTWKTLLEQRDAVATAGTDRLRFRELLQFQVEEIDRAGLQPDEEAVLHSERQRLLHAGRLQELAEEVYAGLQSDDQGVLTKLGRLKRMLEELGRIDATMADCLAPLTDASVLLKELSRHLRVYADRIESNPDRQNAVEERLNLIQRLKSKYGGTLEDVLAAGDRARSELHAIDDCGSRLADLMVDIRRAEDDVSQLARQLSKKRQESAARLTRLVRGELAALKMPRTLLMVTVSETEAHGEFGPLGRDHVEFLLSSNRGEPPKPLARIASGGELSRIMLALKSVLAEQDHVPVLVFDEIDTGMGGAVAAAMGIRLRKLGAFHQVFCITHLPQVAAQADHHVLVEKGEGGRRTATSVKELSGIAREEEIARMLGGVTVTRKVRETAAELIADAGRQG
ncbi:MAG TPA: DNA repair protein RecN [Nitrospira sp.]|nr:DNA repair protein RecN [Nitrospira sp.]